MRLIFKYGSLLFALFTFTVNSNAAENKSVHEYTLNNGLKLIVKEDHRAPVVVTMVWYKVGSAYEPGGITGISHVLEHMMFKGTPTYPAGKFSKLIAANGGEENAFTNTDYTAYFENLARNRLPISFKLEADRMQHLIFNPAEFAEEIKVVREERRMRTDDSPQGITYERFMAAANLANPYQHPIVGWMEDLMNLQVNDVQKWYETWYAPNNATLVVVGDVDPAKILQMAKTHFENIPKRELPNFKPQNEPPSLGQRTVMVKTPAKLPMIIMGYNVPSLVTTKEDWVPYALDVLAGILDGGESARLSRDLVRGKQIANQIDVSYDIYSKFATQFMLYGIPTKNNSPAQLQQALENEILKLQQQPISDTELQRIKNQITAQKIYELDSVFGQAMQLGLLESVGLSWQVGENYVDKIKQVTPEQVQKVAKLYLTPERLTVAVLQPLPLTTNAPQTTLGVQQHEK